MDEMREGTKSFIKRIWSKVGIRSIVPFHIKYEWFYVYKLVIPETGESFDCYFPTVNKYLVKLFFMEFLKSYSDNHYLIVWDGAGFHQDNDFDDIDELEFIKLPSYSPELNPVETLWKYYRNHTCNRSFESIVDIEKVFMKVSNYLFEHTEEVKKQTLFNWINEIITTNN
jgi:transposase